MTDKQKNPNVMLVQSAACRNFLNYIKSTILQFGSPSFGRLIIYCPQEILRPIPDIKAVANKKIVIIVNHVGGVTQIKFEILIGNVTDYSNQVIRHNHYHTRFNLQPPCQLAYNVTNLSVAAHISGVIVVNLLIKTHFYETSLIVIPANVIGVINEIVSSPPLSELPGAGC